MKLKPTLIASVIFISLAFILAQFSDFFSNRSKYVVHVNDVISKKKNKIDLYFSNLLETDEYSESNKILNTSKESIFLYKYINDSLVFWSSNAVPIADYYDGQLFEHRIVKIFHSFYYAKTFKQDSVTLVGLYQLKSRYAYDNKLLHSGYNHDFKLPQSSKLSLDEKVGSPVYDSDGQYLFSLLVSEPDQGVTTRSVLAVIFLFCGIIGLGFSIYLFLKSIADDKKRFRIFVFISGIIFLRLAQLLLALNFSAFLLFDPFIYADSVLVPSLGDLLINSLIFLLVILLVTHSVKLPAKSEITNAFRNIGMHLGFSLLLLTAFIYAHYFCHSLIFNSNISFQPNEIDQISSTSLISYFINGINFLAVSVLLIWVVRSVIYKLNFLNFFLIYIFPTGVLLRVLFLIGYPIDLLSAIFYPGFIAFIYILYHQKQNIYNYSYLVVFVILFSFYLLMVVGHKSKEKESVIRTSLVLSLANEHDPVAEFLFEDLSRNLKSDSAIIKRLNEELIDIDEFYEYLKKNHFSGFWNKYDIQIAICGPSDSVLIEIPEYQWYYCYGFYESIVEYSGIKLPESDFYYLDKHDGRISYLGEIVYEINSDPGEKTLFIELDSRLTNELLGYPELLLNEKFHQQRLIDKYSYAKYHRGVLVAQFGKFSYSLSSDIFGKSENEMYFVSLDDYEHLVYKSGKDSIIVVSRPKIRFIDRLIAFSYLFLFYYLCLIIYIAINNLGKPGERPLSNLRSKIQFTIISVLFTSMILIAASTIWLNIRSYKLNQNKILNEKIHSVLIELTHKLHYEDELSPYWSADKYDNLDQLLIKFSDVFYTDINLYDPAGDLLATSRSEIFDMGLQSTKIDPVAYYKLSREKRSRFIHRENISELSYLSAYVPFENAEGKLLAYLNLPYFTKQKELQLAISALIVTIVNIYVILFLVTIIITFIISDQITKPLEILQQNFRQLKLGGRHEHIEYKRQDEIGSLVAEYNRMVEELERSVEMLARSERESAWREMAKQIAHEIKNPLTPMRLSVQQLQKSWRDKKEDYDEYFNRVSNTLIEQIDNLSAIASEFSSFAKMPVANITEIDIVETVKNVVELFEGGKNYKIVFTSEIDQVNIKADKEQLSRVFINIIKNGIQAVPDDKQGLINVLVFKENQFVNVRISDNGKGISDEIKSKLFMPNFTTKSSGMGLGLAIVQNIVEQIGGNISFKTKLGEGSIFTLKFPISK
ncbi:MAG: GHKL domain-containing protein [Bacteroidales bacterium]|nr:GHKL domain-containing protein [Bacteroidales bacterium]